MCVRAGAWVCACVQEAGTTLTAAHRQYQVQGATILDVVVAEGVIIHKLLSGEDQALPINRNSLLVLNLLLDIINCVRGLDIKGDSLPCQRLDENLHCLFRS